MQNHPIRSTYGTIMHKEKQGILERWADHFNTLLNQNNPTDPTVLQPLTTQSSHLRTSLMTHPGSEKSLSLGAVQSLKDNKSAGPD